MGESLKTPDHTDIPVEKLKLSSNGVHTAPFRYNLLPQKRILSIDTFRGITILVMIFVNEMAGVSNIPPWMKHMPADADAMTFVDVVFPAFLFIVGMSIPFAMNIRLAKGDSFFQLQWHIIVRTLGLLVLGVFLVNTEGGYNEAAMGMSIHLWALCFFASAILVWNAYPFKNQRLEYVLRGLGIAGLISMALIYRGGDGTEHLQPRWWGILGLIGWAYLYASILYQLVRGKKIPLMIMLAACIGFYMLGKTSLVQNTDALSWIAAQSGKVVQTSLTLAGIILSLLFFEQKPGLTSSRRWMEATAFGVSLFLAGFFLRPLYTISKIYATPTWALYSAGFCVFIYMLLYWVIDLKNHQKWTTFFKPAASNPLLTYIIPSILYAGFRYFDFYPVPGFMETGMPGILWSLTYAILIMWLVKGLNRLNIRLRL